MKTLWITVLIAASTACTSPLAEVPTDATIEVSFASMAGHSSIIATPSGSHIVFYGVLEQSSQAEQRSRFIVGPRHFTLLTESIDTTALHDLQPQYGDCSDESTSDREYIKVRRTHMGSTQTSAMCNTAAPASIRRLITVADSLIRVTVTQ